MKPQLYARPEGEPVTLEVAPVLASWDKAGSPSQQRLAGFLAAAQEALSPQLSGLTSGLALRLDVGLQTSVDVLAERDLDNYLYPLVSYLSKPHGGSDEVVARAFVSAFATKGHAARSYARVEVARPAAPSTESGFECEVRTTASASTAAYKQQIQDQVAHAIEIAPGPVSLELAFAVGPRRTNWLSLWKPTIDALDPLLGRTRMGPSWHPRDGRITNLGLHCQIDPELQYDVRIAVRARSLAPH